MKRFTYEFWWIPCALVKCVAFCNKAVTEDSYSCGIRTVGNSVVIFGKSWLKPAGISKACVAWANLNSWVFGVLKGNALRSTLKGQHSENCFNMTSFMLHEHHLWGNEITWITLGILLRAPLKYLRERLPQWNVLGQQLFPIKNDNISLNAWHDSLLFAMGKGKENTFWACFHCGLLTGRLRRKPQPTS